MGSDARPGRAWRGQGGGQNRGKAVDAQVSRLVNLGGLATKSPSMRLSRMVFSALDYYNLEPIIAQRVVIDSAKGIATAADIVCQREDQLVLVELKCGYAGDRTAPAMCRGCACRLNSPCSTASDTTTNRHMAQLAATLFMFRCESETIHGLKRMGINRVCGALLYVGEDEGSVLYELPLWWEKRAKRLIEMIA